MKKSKKTKAKQIGVKGLFTHGDGKLTMTTFGCGNETKILFTAEDKGRDFPEEKKIEKITIQRPNEFVGVSASINDKVLHTKLKNAAMLPQEDYLKLKPVLETLIFGCPFPNDNIRIQIAYNILDIMKILGLYIDDIILAIYNLQPYNNETRERLGESLSCDDKVYRILVSMRSYLGFFSDVFKIIQYNDPQKNEKMEHNIQVMRTLSSIRHLTAHHKIMDNPLFKSSASYTENLFTKKGGDWKILWKCYNEKIKNVNQMILKNSKVNLQFIFKYLKVETPQKKAEITEDFYRFTIMKDGKTLGINLIRVREMVILFHMRELNQKKHEAYRQKINIIMDYFIFRAVHKHTNSENYLNLLRTAPDEKTKEEIYFQISEKVWTTWKRVFSELYEDAQTRMPALILKYQTEQDINRKQAEKNILSPSNAIPFVVMIAFLCNFLEKKDINKLLTAYIHKFENIQDLLNLLQKFGEEVTFTQNFQIFTEFNGQFAAKVVDQLRVLASIGKIKPDLETAKRPLYIEALKMLGCSHEYITEKWIENNLLLNSYGRKNEKKIREVNPFRNFIASNVIASRRFLYLMRYAKPEAVRVLMENHEIVRYTLTQIPQTQIDFCAELLGCNGNKKYEILTNKLIQFSFKVLNNQREVIWKNNQPRYRNHYTETAIEKLKALTNLYIMTAYTAVKNLVQVNARYYIAYSIYERDLDLFRYRPDFRAEYGGESRKVQCEKIGFALTLHLLEEERKKDFPEEITQENRLRYYEHMKKTKRHFKKKWRDILEKEIQEAYRIHETGFLPIFTRNKIMHLEVLTSFSRFISDFKKDQSRMTSWFELFHYILQRLTLSYAEKKGFKLDNYSAEILENGVPNKNLTHVTFVTFGYNLPRYKNLTTEALFIQENNFENG